MWLYIPSTCAVDTTDSDSPLTSQQAETLARSVMWRSKYRQPRFWQTLWAKGFYPKRLSGATCEPSTAEYGVALWILSLQGIRVNHSQSPESVVAKAIRDTCGPKWLESWRNASQSLVSSRTSEGISGSDLTESQKTWNDWATALRRVCLQRRKLAQATRESGCSSWPTAKTATGDYSYAGGDPTKIVMNLEGAAKQWLTPHGFANTDQSGHEAGAAGEFGRQVKEWATPAPSDVKGSAKIGQRRGQLSEAILTGQWATTASADSVGSHGVGQGRSLRTDIAENWATPQAFDANDVTRLTPCSTAGCRTLANWPTPKSNEANSPGIHGNGGQDLRTVVAENCSLQAQATGDGDESSNDGPTSRPQLNPRFVEWLMGVPRGWISLECSATELSRYKELMRSALLRLCSGSEDRIEP